MHRFSGPTGQLHVVERFSLAPGETALRREFVAEEPSFFEGEFRGFDVMLPSALPYHGTTSCQDRTYR